MFEELIKEINRRIKNLESMMIGFDVEEEAIMVEVKQQTYESVLELVKSYIPQPQDKPDKEGAWLFTEGIWQDKVEFSLHYICKDVYGDLMIPSMPKGFWFVALLPEVEHET